MKTIHSAAILFLVLIYTTTATSGATCVAIASGKWEQSGTWLGGNIPVCGDSIVIGAAYTVEITSVLDYTLCVTPMQVNVSGILTFQTGKKLRLPCSSYVQVNIGGSVTAGNGGGNSNLIDICDYTVWNAAQGTVNGYAILQYNPLPIELLHFSARVQGTQVLLLWNTISEVNNKCFIVEKGKNGSDFDELARVNGAGTSSNIHAYKMLDANPFNGIQYYRLKQQDYDGKITTHNTVAINYSHQSKFSIYPNPTTGDLFANVDIKMEGEMCQLVVNRSDGKHLLTKEFQIAKKTYGIKLLDDAEMLKSGTYLVTLNFKGDSFTQYVISK